jgi:hypothetical protein
VRPTAFGPPVETHVEALLGAGAAQIAARASARVKDEIKKLGAAKLWRWPPRPHEWIRPAAGGGIIVKLDAGVSTPITPQLARSRYGGTLLAPPSNGASITEPRSYWLRCWV